MTILKNYPFIHNNKLIILFFWEQTRFLQKNGGMIDGYERIPKNNERALRKVVAKQPVSVAIDSRSISFRNYPGVIKKKCQIVGIQH